MKTKEGHRLLKLTRTHQLAVCIGDLTPVQAEFLLQDKEEGERTEETSLAEMFQERVKY